MTPQERVARLEGLLDRIRKNREVPRKAVVAAAPPAPAAKSSPVAAVKSSPVAAVKSSPVAAPPPFVVTEPPPPVVVTEPPVETLPPPVESAPPPSHFQESAAAGPLAASEPPTLPPAPTPAPAAAWAAEPPSAVQPRPGTLPPEELSDDDLLEVTTIPPAAQAEADMALAPTGDEDIELDDDAEQPPASSRRSKVLETLEDALSAEARLEPMDEEREVPVKTPPPESGPQEAVLPQGLEAAGIPDVERLEADLMGPPSMGPTAEQLGETIELEAPRGPELEIDVAAASATAFEVPERAPEELEISLPRAPMPSGTYDVAVSEPEAPELDVTIPPVDMPLSADAVPTIPAAAAPEEAAPLRTARPAHGATDVARVVLPPHASAQNFVELLDISLGL